MLDLDWKANMATPQISARSPRLPDKPSLPIHSSPRVGDASAIAAYEHYLRLPELSKLWSSKEFPKWRSESIIKPSLQALEITFRLVSLAVSDPRPYANHREWKRRLESLATSQIELIAALCEEEQPHSGAPISGLSSCKVHPVVSRTSGASLLSRLATWERSEDVASKILFQIEAQMQRCPFTLGLGEPNLIGKPNLEYDLVVRPTDLHSIKKSPSESKNHENQTLVTIHQIFESWIYVARELLWRIGERIDGRGWEKGASDCWLLERIWKLLAEVEDLHLLMDPDDFLRLKSQLAIRSTFGGSSEAYCFRSTALVEITSSSRDLKRKVPWILGVEVDPNGGPRVQQAAMGLFHSRRRGEEENSGRIHLLQAFQAVEAAVKKFYFAYRQLITAAMGSLEAAGNGLTSTESSDSLSQMFLEPPYFPSLDAAKTFLGELWQYRA